ncbi:uncharacterized protein LOC129872441 [Solanum dulcamara]|uniref:uncharacterized protein LOC129872441 n=1 Tax=Solanum dulcamara TaxID=45834 RepID=UPI0024853D6E|nr:uncharacterized protein LOC129872441 [Solanum dulcamara]
MSSLQVNSFQDLVPPPTSEQSYNDSTLEGVAANFKLLLKLIQDHKDACNKENTDGLRMLRVATMMTILDNVRTRIQKCQSFGDKRSSETKLRRCYTDVKLTSNARKEKKQDEVIIDEKERLKRQLNGSLVARKSLEVMCWSLGKEKEIMAAELSKKVHEVNEMEDLINELKEQNECLVERLHGCSVEKQEINVEKNKSLSEQLLRSLDGYKSMKRKWKNAHEENMTLHATLEEMGVQIESGIHLFRQQITFVEKIIKLENVIESLEMQVAKHLQNDKVTSI